MSRLNDTGFLAGWSAPKDCDEASSNRAATTAHLIKAVLPTGSIVPLPSPPESPLTPDPSPPYSGARGDGEDRLSLMECLAEERKQRLGGRIVGQAEVRVELVMVGLP